MHGRLATKTWRLIRQPIPIVSCSPRYVYRYLHATPESRPGQDQVGVDPITSEDLTQQPPSYKSPRSFPWVLSTDGPRIPSYPYPVAPTVWSLLNYLPTFAQREMSKYLGTRMLRLNTGMSYFPEQFLIGSTIATRKALELLSQELNKENKETSERVRSIFAPAILQKLKDARKELDPAVQIDISIPQVYDAVIKDIWITLGSPRAFENNRQYEIMEWMTLTIGVKAARQQEEEEKFSDYRGRVAKGLMDGAHFKVDVEIDADVEYKVSSPKSLDNNDDSVLIYDRGRRPLIISFETPYFEPADRMVAGRDEDDEPIMDWNWRISDIDQLLAKEALEERK